MKRTILLIATLLVYASLGAAHLRLPHVFTDHAVLQRESTVKVWGWGEPGKTVNVSNTWNFRTEKTTVAKDGTWSVRIATGKAGGPYSLRVNCGKETLVMDDVMLGEVWICSGQSNMDMPVGGYGFQQVEGSRDAILDAPETARDIRVFKINEPCCTEPQDDVDAQWKLSGPAVTAGVSAVGYFFAKRLTKALGVPVGIIVNAWGGSRIEPWMTMEAIKGSGISAEELAEIEALEPHPEWPRNPELIWNGRMKPVAGYGARGFLWYQGCSNIGQDCYDKLQTAMVKMWREEWGNQDMPFIYALLAPYSHGDSNGRWRPQFVRTQMRAMNTTPNAYAVCLETLGDEGTIHPSKKREVADMMFLRAYSSVYGEFAGMPADYPEPRTIDYQDDGRVRITFTNVWSNLMSITARDVVGFELAGEDRVFHLAKAEVDWDGQTVFVRCDDVPRPVAVRYAFRNYMGANLQTTYGLPVPPFRTDDWPL